jgi:hypothetical protein
MLPVLRTHLLVAERFELLQRFFEGHGHRFGLQAGYVSA